jgi:hypothetical protein
MEATSLGAQPDIQQRPDLSSILKKAQEAGKQQRAENVAAVKQGGSELRASLVLRVTQAREKAIQAWTGVKESGKQLKADTVKYTDVAIGIATNSEVRAALGGYMQEKVHDAREKLNTKYGEIREAILDKKDQAVSRFQEGVRGLWRNANEKLVQPQITKAKEIATNIRQKWGEIKAAGRETGEKVVNFFQQQAESTRNGIRARGAEIGAAWNDVLAKPREARAALLGKLGEKLVGTANADKSAAEQHRVRATEHRASASIIRTGGAVAAGIK